MLSRPAPLLLAAFFVAGCGPLKLPRSTPAPDLARLKERCPSFIVLSPEKIEVGPSDFAGKPLVVLGVHHQYLRDLGPWMELFGDRGEKFAVIVVIEDATTGTYARVSAVLPSGTDIHFDPPSKWDRIYAESFRLRRRAADARLDSAKKADKLESKAERMKAIADAHAPGFRRALGLVGEGPHVAVIGADGTLLALVDGPRINRRERKVTTAIDVALMAADNTSQ